MSSIPGGRRSWITVCFVFFNSFFILSAVEFLGSHFQEAYSPFISTGWLYALSIVALVLALSLLRHWKDWAAIFSVWALSPLAVLASYGFSIATLILVDLALQGDAY
jgi:uncharacterized membrane protein YfhO